MAKTKNYKKEDILQFLTIINEKTMSGKELSEALEEKGVFAKNEEGKLDCRFLNFTRTITRMLGDDSLETIKRGNKPSLYRLAITQDEALTRLEDYQRVRKSTTPKEEEMVKVEEKEENVIISCARKIVDYYDNHENYTLKEVDKLLEFIQTSGFNYKTAIEFVLNTRKEDLMKREQELSTKYLGN